MTEHILFTVNGQPVELDVQSNWTLLFVLREKLGLTGAKPGCETGDCGTCTILMDGEPVHSCVMNARKAQGHSILTIEGLQQGAKLHPIQQAFIDAGAVQCGYCTPGMILVTKALLDKNPKPTRREAALALKNNLCRCTGYVKIVDAVLLAAERMQEVAQ